MQCPKCGSDNTQRLQVVYEHGTQNISTTSSSVGGGLSGALGAGVAHTTTEGTSQSTMAQKSAPPEKLNWGVFLIILIIGIMIFSNSESIGWKLGSGLIVVGMGFLIKNAFQFNKNEWPKLYQTWMESWICNKCGGFYHQPLN
jgi:hypothetical protein